MIRGKEERLARIRVTDNMPGWRNGRRCGLKIRCPKGRAGSTPALGTTIKSKAYKVGLSFYGHVISVPIGAPPLPVTTSSSSQLFTSLREGTLFNILSTMFGGSWWYEGKMFHWAWYEKLK
jgi:hypothetical protein